MSTVEIKDAGWLAIMGDERLTPARRKLSFHEIRLIVDHARANEPLVGQLVEALTRARWQVTSMDKDKVWISRDVANTVAQIDAALTAAGGGQ